jgi:hypothetical protein
LSDLAREHAADNDKPAPPQRPRPTITIGELILPVGTEHLAELAQAASQSIDEGFLAHRGRAALRDVPGLSKKKADGDAGGRIVVARMPRMTDDQRTAVGLVGEVAARA